MLYQPQRFSLAALAHRAFTMVAGIFNDFTRTNRDTTYVEGLNEFQLRDLGLNRVDREIKRMH
jgi:uncharacterized protein YjiS (DUF1127 family)